jgi:hypothetical protein
MRKEREQQALAAKREKERLALLKKQEQVQKEANSRAKEASRPQEGWHSIRLRSDRTCSSFTGPLV